MRGPVARQKSQPYFLQAVEDGASSLTGPESTGDWRSTVTKHDRSPDYGYHPDFSLGRSDGLDEGYLEDIFVNLVVGQLLSDVEKTIAGKSSSVVWRLGSS